MIIKRTLTSLALAGALAFGLSGCPREIEQIVDDFNKDKKSDIVSVSYKDLSFNYKEPRTRGYSGSFDAYISWGENEGVYSQPQKVFHFKLKPKNLLVGDANGDSNEDLLFVAFNDLSFNYKEPRTRGYSGSFDQYVAFGNGDKTFQEPKKSLHYNIKPEY